VPVEESAPARDAVVVAPLDGNGAAADDPVVPSLDDSWVVKLEQSFNIFATVNQLARHSSSRLNWKHGIQQLPEVTRCGQTCAGGKKVRGPAPSLSSSSCSSQARVDASVFHGPSPSRAHWVGWSSGVASTGSAQCGDREASSRGEGFPPDFIGAHSFPHLA
jgi:hypothetical protein